MNSNIPISKIPISVIIPVKNEAQNLPFCLAALGDSWDEVFVVDSESNDATAEIAKQYGASVIEFKWNGKFPKKRNWFLENYETRNDWCLFLDADEIVNEKFKSELNFALRNHDYNGLWINYTNYFMGRALHHGVPQRKLALFRRSAGCYERIEEDYWSGLDMEIHEHPQLTGPIGEIKTRIDHRDYKGISNFLARHLDYAKWEAARYHRLIAGPVFEKLTLRQKVKYRLIDKPWFGAFYFLFNYFFKLGFIDGQAGLHYSLYKGWYFRTISLMIAEERVNRGNAASQGIDDWPH